MGCLTYYISFSQREYPILMQALKAGLILCVPIPEPLCQSKPSPMISKLYTDSRLRILGTAVGFESLDGYVR